MTTAAHRATPPRRLFRGAGAALLASASALLVVGCAQLPAPGRDGSDLTPPGWHAVLLPGKAPTRYAVTVKDGRPAISARAESSASMWRRRVSVAPPQLGQARFSWWVESLPPQAHVGDAQREDAAARVIFAFDGDLDQLSPRNRAMFDLARALTGEMPPYATLMYVWDNEAPVDSVVVNPRTDRVRKIVLDSGPQHLGRWRDHQRDLAADFRRAFGEEPGRLVAVAVMTDGDNTRSSTRAWYGEVDLSP
jgi:hypothetical protein